jgi:outer membrane protein OmpA-like peptidoglycan-associated protein
MGKEKYMMTRLYLIWQKTQQQRALILIATVAVSMLSSCSNTTRLVDESASIAFEKGVTITDSAYKNSLENLHALQERLHRLRIGSTTINNYQLCKANAWLDMAYTEYTDNDRTGVAIEARQEAEKIIQGLEQGTKNRHYETPILNASRKVRKDLWQLVDQWQDRKDNQCVSCDLARLEVQLGWVGHEYFEQGWRHALAAEQQAERYARALLDSQSQCVQADIIATPDMPKFVHFSLDEHRIDDVSKSIVRRMAESLLLYPNHNILLIGHADFRGADRHNLRLSQRRAESVAKVLTEFGVERQRINIKAVGSLFPVQKGNSLEDLARNRRVELILLPKQSKRSEISSIDLKVEPSTKLKNNQ